MSSRVISPVIDLYLWLWFTFCCGRSPILLNIDVRRMSDDQLTERLRRYGRIGHVRERLARLTTSAREVEEWRKKRRRSTHGKQSYTDADQAMVAKLTRGQTSTIKLHKELKETEAVVQRLPRLPAGASASAGGAGFVGLGNGRGEHREEAYRPPPPQVIKRDVSNEPVPKALGDRMLVLLRRFLTSVESAGDKLAAAASDGQPDSGRLSLWGAYR